MIHEVFILSEYLWFIDSYKSRCIGWIETTIIIVASLIIIVVDYFNTVYLVYRNE